MVVSRLLLVVFGCCLSFTLSASTSLSAEPGQADKLIRQLGSNDFSKREAASRALESLGVPALASLREALDDRDPEIRRRAEALVSIVERKADAEAVLKPTMVTLNYVDTPLRRIVDDLAEAADCELLLNDDVAEKRITLQAGDKPFWQALDLVCNLAGLVQSLEDLDKPTSAEARLESLRREAIILERINASESAEPQRLRKIVLTPGKPEQLPTHYVGALRIRAVPLTQEIAGLSANEGVALLEVLPEPVLPWQLLHVRLSKSVDEAHGDLVQQHWTEAANAGVSTEFRVAGNGVAVQNQILISGNKVTYGSPSGRLYFGPWKEPLRLKAVEEGTPRLASVLKGSLFAKVEMPEEPLLTVDNILDSVKQTYKGKGDVEATICDVRTYGSGSVRVRYELVNPAGEQQILQANNRLVRRRAFARGRVLEVSENLGESVALLDEEGRPYELTSKSHQKQFDNGRLTVINTMYFKAKEGQEAPDKLVFTGSRQAVIQVPIDLQNVPLQ